MNNRTGATKINLIILGDLAVSCKTNFLKSIIGDINSKHSYFGTSSKDIIVQNKPLKVIMSYPFEKEYVSKEVIINPNYFRNKNSALIVYDVSDRKSFEDTAKWIKAVDEYCEKNIYKVLVAYNNNNNANNQIVTNTEASEYAEIKKMKFLEISGNNKTNLDNVFSSLCQDILKDTNLTLSSSFMINDRLKKKKEKNCC